MIKTENEPLWNEALRRFFGAGKK